MSNTCFVLPCKGNGGGGCPCPYPSHFNTTDGTTDGRINDIAIWNRYVSHPTSGEFLTDGWDDHNLHPVTDDSTVIYAPIEKILFDDLSTDFYATVTDGSGAVIAALVVSNVTGNGTHSQNGITLEITDFGASGDKYEGNVRFTFDLGTIFGGASGYTEIEMRHESGGNAYTKNQIFFYDSRPLTASLSGVTISEDTPNRLTNYLSGVQFYSLSSPFIVDIADIDYLNADSYPNTQVQITGSDYGLPTLNISGENGDITDWVYDWNDSDDSYHNGDWEITAMNFCHEGPGHVTAHVIDWVVGPDVNSADQNILVNTWVQQSNELEEHFHDEIFRQTSTRGTWDSTQDLRNYDDQNGAQVICGRLQAPDTDYSGYAPLTNPDYSNYNGNTYYRSFIDVQGLVRGSAHLHIQGFTLDDLIHNRIELWFFIPGKWTSECYAHTTEVFNYSTFNGDNDPIRVSDSTTDDIHISFGTLGLDSSHDTLEWRLVINDASIKPTDIVLTWD